MKMSELTERNNYFEDFAVGEVIKHVRSKTLEPLEQVLITNLVMNAAKHGFNNTQPGTITVTCARDGERACITVMDDGVGIPPENLGKIFDPFFTTKLGQGGTGLGLHISHNMVYGPLGGRITVHSAPTVATRFTLHLPFIAPDAHRS